MPTYAIGDVQGCYRTLQKLLATLDVRPSRDRIVLLGDLVGRGPDALGVLRFVADNEAYVSAVLGNHDLALLACHQSLLRPHASDKLDEVLAAPDVARLLTHLRRFPFVQWQQGHMLLHAGVMPAWGRADIERRAAAASAVIQDEQKAAPFLARFFRLPGASTPSDEERYVDESIEVLTCLRTLDANGLPYAAFKGELKSLPEGVTPWFRWPSPAWQGVPICCGHWSALGLYQEARVTALDGGCIWGRSLCAMRLDDGELFEVQNVEDG